MGRASGRTRSRARNGVRPGIPPGLLPNGPSAPNPPIELSLKGPGVKNHGTPRTKLVASVRQTQVIELCIKQGWSVAQAANHLNVADNVIRRDLRNIQENWLARKEELAEHWIAEDLARLEMVEQETWKLYAKTPSLDHLDLLLKVLVERRKLITVMHFQGDTSAKHQINQTWVQIVTKEGAMPTELSQAVLDYNRVIDAKTVNP